MTVLTRVSGRYGYYQSVQLSKQPYPKETPKKIIVKDLIAMHVGYFLKLVKERAYFNPSIRNRALKKTVYFWFCYKFINDYSQ